MTIVIKKTHNLKLVHTWCAESQHRLVGFYTAYFRITTEDVWLSVIPILQLPPRSWINIRKYVTNKSSVISVLAKNRIMRIKTPCASFNYFSFKPMANTKSLSCAVLLAWLSNVLLRQNGYKCNKVTSPFVMLMAKYMSPNDPDPIFLTSLYFPPTINSALEPLLLAIVSTKWQSPLDIP